MSFFDELQQRTAGARAELFAIPVIRECLAGRVTRDAVPRVSCTRPITTSSTRCRC